MSGLAVTRAGVGVLGRDLEDLARTADGTLWLADVGDNDRERSTMALIPLPTDGPGTVVWSWATDRPLPEAAADPLPLRAAGEVRLLRSTTEDGSASFLGRGLITGGALSDDGWTAAGHTYTDAWLVPVPGRTP